MSISGSSQRNATLITARVRVMQLLEHHSLICIQQVNITRTQVTIEAGMERARNMEHPHERQRGRQRQAARNARARILSHARQTRRDAREAREERLRRAQARDRSESSEPEIVDELWAVQCVAGLRIEYTWDGRMAADVLVVWQWNGNSRGATWEPVESVWDSCPQTVRAFMNEWRAHNEILRANV